MANRQALLLGLVVVALELAAAQNYFRGAIFHWRSVDPARCDGRVRIMAELWLAF